MIIGRFSLFACSVIFHLPFLLVSKKVRKFCEAQDGVCLFTVIFWDPGSAAAIYKVLEKHFGSERMNERDRLPALRSTGLVNEIDDCSTVLEVQK